MRLITYGRNRLRIGVLKVRHNGLDPTAIVAMRLRIITKGNPHWGNPRSSWDDITALTYEVARLGQQPQFPWWHDELVNFHYQVSRHSARTWYPQLLSIV